MNRDELKGKAKVLKGKIKETAGELTHNRRLRAEGVVDQVAGKTQSAVGSVRRKVGEAVEGIRSATKK